MQELRQNPHVQACIVDCLECYTVCRQGGRHEDAEHVRLMQDCAELCRTTADFLLRGSSFSAQLAAACADVCSACAESCEALDQQASAEACRGCARSCRRVANEG